MKKICMILPLLIVLVGCASTNSFPKFPNFIRSDINRIGIYIDVSGIPHHVHNGVTTIGDFKKTYSNSWKLDELITERFTEKLEKEGLEVVNLEEKGFNYFQIDQLIIAREGEWMHNPDRSTSLNRIRNDLNLQAVVIVKGKRVVADMEVTPTGAKYPIEWASGSGLYSSYSLVLKKYRAIAAFDVSLFLFQPPVNISAYSPLESQDYFRTIELKDFSPLKNVKSITKEEFKPVFSAIDEYISDAADLVICSLKMGSNYPDDLWDCLPDKFKAK